MSFADYLNNREGALKNMTETLQKEINQETRASNVDERIWKPKMGSDNTGYAVVRFLPGLDVNKTPWIRKYSHGFQGPTGKWYIEDSLTTLGQKDPVSEYNTRLWNNGTEAGKDQARKQKRRTTYYANVLVIKDAANPQNEGKVKIFSFGQRIFDKVMAAMQPEFADEDPVNPFDLIEGANFRIKLKMVAGYWNYDSSDFERQAPLSEDNSKLESVFNSQYDIHEMVEPSSFKTYDELQTHLFSVLEEGGTAPAAAPVQQQAPAAPVQEKSEFDDYFKKEETSTTTTSTSSDDEDLESYFKSLSAD